MWWLSGLFRSVELLARPAGCVGDLFVHAGADGTLRVDADVPARVVVPELGIDAAAGETVAAGPVEPWSAELPRLYDGELRAEGETVRAADRLPHRRRRGRRAARQRPPRAAARRQPPRVGPRPRPRADRGRHAPRRRADEGAQRQRRPHGALPAAPALPRALRRARPLRDRRVRPRDARLPGGRLARQPQRRPALARRLPGPDPAHGRARQEPPERDPVVARQRERDREQPRRDGGVGARARPVAAAALRARPDGDARRRAQPHVRDARRGRGARPPRGAAAGGPGARRRPAREAVPAVRVRARDGQRAGRPGRVPGAVRGAPALRRRVRVGVDRPRHPPRRRATSPTAATSASRCTTATSSPTGSCCPTARPRRGWPSSRPCSRPCGSASAGSRTCTPSATSRT